jgi:hypothetical protein
MPACLPAARVGDTWHHYRRPVPALPGFKPAKSMVFAGEAGRSINSYASFLQMGRRLLAGTPWEQQQQQQQPRNATRPSVRGTAVEHMCFGCLKQRRPCISCVVQASSRCLPQALNSCRQPWSG